MLAKLLAIYWVLLEWDYSVERNKFNCHERKGHECELAKIEEVEEGATVQVLDEPVAPYEKSSPKVLLSLFLAAFIGFGGGVIVAYLLDGLD